MNVKTKLSRLQMLSIALGALTLGTVALRTVALLLFFNNETGYFAKSGVVIAFYVLELLAAALCVAFPFLIKKEPVAACDAPLSIGGLFGAGLCALTTVICAVFFLVRRTRIPAPAVIVLLTAVFLLGAAAYFINQFRVKQTPATTLPFGYAAILGAALLLATLYFDLTTPMNAPHKVSLQIALLATMAAILYELRIATGEPMPRVQAAVTGFACFACAVSGIPNTIAFLTDVYDSTPYLFADLTAAALSVYFAAKSVSICLATKTSEGEADK